MHLCTNALHYIICIPNEKEYFLFNNYPKRVDFNKGLRYTYQKYKILYIILLFTL